MAFQKLRDKLKGFSEQIVAPIIVLFSKAGLTPNAVTWIGLVITCFGAFFIVKGNFLLAALIILIGSIFDMLDGVLARKTGKKTKFGGFLDSTVDRIAEGAMYLAVLVYYVDINYKYGIILAYAVMFLSFLISYTRSRAGALKIDCEVGILTRPERVILFILGLLMNKIFWAMIVIGVFSLITVIQRIWWVFIKADKLENN